jgi:hypothetical protein
MTQGSDSSQSGQDDAHALGASSDAAETGFSDREVGGAVLPCQAQLRFRLDVEAEPPLVLELTSEAIAPPPPAEEHP